MICQASVLIFNICLGNIHKKERKCAKIKNVKADGKLTLIIAN